MTRWTLVLEGSWDLRLICYLFIPLHLAAALAPGGALQVLLGLPFVLVLPGYVLAAALFPRGGLTRLERAALSCGLSIVAVPLLGLLLAITGWGIGPSSALAAVTCLILLGSLVAARRRATAPARGPLVVPLPAVAHVWTRRPPAEKALLGGIAACILVTGALLVAGFTLPAAREPFTEAALLNESGGAGAYPSLLRPGDGARFQVEIANHEGTAMAYVVRARWSGAAFANATPEEALAAPDAHVQLGAGERTLLPLSVVAPATPGLHRLDVTLHKSPSSSPYRSLHLWIRVEPAQEAPLGPEDVDGTLTVVGPDGTPASLQRALRPGGQARLTLLVNNTYASPSQFQVLTRWIPVAPDGTHGTTREGPRFATPQLAPEQAWVQDVNLQPPEGTGRFDLYVRLDKEGAPTEARELWLTFTVA